MPYTKGLGVAVFRFDELVHFAVKTLQAPRTVENIRSSAERHVTNLIVDFGPDLVVIKALTRRQRRSTRQSQLAAATKRVAAKNLVALRFFSISTVGRSLQIGRVPAKQAIIAKVRSEYPELSRFDRFQNRSQKEYYLPMLWAVAIGLALQKRKGRVNTAPTPDKKFRSIPLISTVHKSKRRQSSRYTNIKTPFYLCSNKMKNESRWPTLFHNYRPRS